MGRRIHVVLGYGFKYSKIQEDPRFRKDLFKKDFYERSYKKDLIDFFIKRNDILDRLYIEEIEKCESELTACDFCKYDFEVERTSPFVVTDPTQSDWNRYDDIIDYYTYSNVTEVKLIKDSNGMSYGIYPYLTYVDRRSGERLSLTAVERRILGNYALFPKDFDWKYEKDGFKINSVLEAQRIIVPELSPVISAFIDLAKPFVQERNKYYLRPMVFSYWG